MKNISLVLLISLLFISCASFNKGEGKLELHLSKNISTGQELIDLNNALIQGVISQEEFELLKSKIIEGDQSISLDLEVLEVDEDDKEVKVKLKISN